MAKEKPKTKAPAKRKGVTKKFTFTADNGKVYEITLKQKLFCEEYIDPFASAADATIEAGYNVFNSRGNVNRNLAKSIGNENLSKPAICAYLRLLLEEHSGLTDEAVDKQMAYNIKQFKDLNASNRAISEYNKIKGRHAPEKHDHTIKTVNVIKYGDK